MDPQTYAAGQAADPSENWYDRCQKFVRTALGFQNGVAGGGSAREEYNYTKQRGDIRTDATPPPNVPVYFDTRGSAGHVALSAGGGYAWTTDEDGPGTVSLHKISDIAKWAGPYMGYGLSEGGNTLDAAESGGNPLTDAGKKALNAGATFLDPLGLVPGHSSIHSIPGVPNVGGYIDNKVGDAASSAASAVGSGILAGLKAVFTADFMKRLLAAVAGALLILMTVYRLSGMTAVPVPV